VGEVVAEGETVPLQTRDSGLPQTVEELVERMRFKPEQHTVPAE
jgi:hypothetical protein